MKTRSVNAEQLLGRMVHDVANRRVGRIEEIELEVVGAVCRVTNFVLGEHGLLQRLSFRGLAPLFFRRLAAKHATRQNRVPWAKMDLSRPKHPTLTCRKEEL